MPGIGGSHNKQHRRAAMKAVDARRGPAAPYPTTRPRRARVPPFIRLLRRCISGSPAARRMGPKFGAISGSKGRRWDPKLSEFGGWGWHPGPRSRRLDQTPRPPCPRSPPAAPTPAVRTNSPASDAEVVGACVGEIPPRLGGPLQSHAMRAVEPPREAWHAVAVLLTYGSWLCRSTPSIRARFLGPQ